MYIYTYADIVSYTAYSTRIMH